MARGVHDLKLEVAQLEDVAVFEAHVGEFVAPVLAAFVREVQLCPGQPGKLARPGEEVGMDVRLSDFGDAHLVVCGDLQVGIHIALRVDDDGFARLLAADEVAGLGQRFIINMLEKHTD